LLLAAQQQKELILESIENPKGCLKIIDLHLDAQQQQKLVLENLKKSVEFISQLSELESDAQQQKEFTLENIEHLKSELVETY